MKRAMPASIPILQFAKTFINLRANLYRNTVQVPGSKCCKCLGKDFRHNLSTSEYSVCTFKIFWWDKNKSLLMHFIKKMSLTTPGFYLCGEDSWRSFQAGK